METNTHRWSGIGIENWIEKVFGYTNQFQAITNIRMELRWIIIINRNSNEITVYILGLLSVIIWSFVYICMLIRYTCINCVNVFVHFYREFIYYAVYGKRGLCIAYIQIAMRLVSCTVCCWMQSKQIIFLSLSRLIFIIIFYIKIKQQWKMYRKKEYHSHKIRMLIPSE